MLILFLEILINYMVYRKGINVLLLNGCKRVINEGCKRFGIKWVLTCRYLRREN